VFHAEQEVHVLRSRHNQSRKEPPIILPQNIFAPGPTPNTVRSTTGKVLAVPDGWALLPPGDAALTRRVKAAGEHWVVQEKKGRKVFSRGVWAPASTIDTIRAELEAERSTQQYSKRKQADARRRDKIQAEYVEDFFQAVLEFLAFHPRHAETGQRLARAVADHATPVGSGTVARTQRIPVEQRAEAAVIAWMRHQTTAYESMKIPRIRGKRREVRRMLAQRSQELLGRYRSDEIVGDGCPLRQALNATVNLSSGPVSEQL
jgi:TfoX/Sxy family transcriptional regulator of competence genes